MPGCLIAMGRLNRPAIMVYGGTIRPGKWNGTSLDIVSAFNAMVSTCRVRSAKKSARKSCGGRARCWRLRWYVYRQYDGIGDRSPRDVAALQRFDTSRGPSQTDECRRAGQSHPASAGERHQAARHYDARCVFENAMVVVIALGVQPMQCCI